MEMRGEELRRRNVSLACLLTEEEIEEFKGELVEWTTIRGERESELDSWKADKREEQKLYEAEIMSASARLVRTAKLIESGKEYRNVEVIDLIEGSTVTSIRTDTGEVIAQRSADPAELQRPIPLGTPEHITSDGEPTDPEFPPEPEEDGPSEEEREDTGGFSRH